MWSGRCAELAIAGSSRTPSATSSRCRGKNLFWSTPDITQARLICSCRENLAGTLGHESPLAWSSESVFVFFSQAPPSQDPEEFHYALQQWAGPMGPNWYKYLLTVPWIPVIHFFGLNDTGFLFALEWWMSFPEADASGRCNKEFWTKWMPRRLKHNAVVLSLWACVWLLGTWPLGRPLSQGWRFVLPVTCAARVGFSLAWMFITNFTHSLPWNKFLEKDPGRTWPTLHNIMAVAVGGKHRWNEMLFHDVHHAFPNALGTLSQRGRFHGWKKAWRARFRLGGGQ